MIIINFRKFVPESEDQVSYKQRTYSLIIEKWIKPVRKLQTEM